MRVRAAQANTLNLLCVLFAVFAAPSLAQQTQGVAERSPARKSQATKQPERQQYPTENAPLPIRVIESPSDAADRQRSAASAAEHEKADLKAQERSASAAEQQVSVGTVVAWLSAAGLFALIWTLCETRRAASAATRAAVAAENTLAHATTSSEKQLRAYVSHDSEGLPHLYERDNAWYSAEFLIRNSGQTPAHAVRVWAKLEALPRDLPKSHIFEKPTSEDGFGNRFVVSPGSRHTHNVSYEAKSPQMHSAIERGDQALYQWGEIRYNDGFAKEQRRTRFRLRLLLWDKADGKRVGIWSYCEDGNDAT